MLLAWRGAFGRAFPQRPLDAMPGTVHMYSTSLCNYDLFSDSVRFVFEWTRAGNTTIVLFRQDAMRFI